MTEVGDPQVFVNAGRRGNWFEEERSVPRIDATGPGTRASRAADPVIYGCVQDPACCRALGLPCT